VTLTAAVVGPSALMQDALERLLSHGGITVHGDLAAEDDGPSVVVLVDPTDDHWEAARASSAPIVVVVDHEPSDGEVVAKVMQGADAVLHADSRPESLFAAVALVGGGGTELTPVQSRTLAALARSAVREPSVALTRREAEIIESIARGQSVKQTAISLGISAKTVENLQGRLFRKLGVRNRAQAVAQSHALGLLSPSP
jgi:two-component system, NarL family, nitrate/nitrite response regulator NarL